MNYNGGHMRNINRGFVRKRKLPDVQSCNKRFRYTNYLRSERPPLFTNQPFNHVPVQASTKTSNETVHGSIFSYKSPTTEQSNTKDSPYKPKSPHINRYSANDRIKAYRQRLGSTSDSNQSQGNSSSSCTNSSSSKCSNMKPSYTAQPSRLQDRLKLLRTQNSNQSGPAQPSTVNNKPDISKELFSSSSNNADNSDDDDSMDWCAFEEREVLDNITKLRKNNSIPKIAPATKFQQKLSNTLMKMPLNQSMFREIYIVTDTNIFLSNLNLIDELLSLKVNSVCGPYVMIPWTVIQELDYLKDSMYQSNLKNNAKIAIKYINEKLACDHPQVKGQSVHDAAEQNFASRNADDAILFCCLQIKERQHNPILLSNDTNLRNKAMINGVLAYSHKTIIDGLDPYRDTGDGLELQPGFDYSKVKAVEVLFSNFFSFIIHSKTLEAYGSSRDIMYPELKTPPWSLLKCLTLLKKFWRSIFSIFLKRHFMYTVNQYIELISKHEDLESMGPAKIKAFVDTGLELYEYIEKGCMAYKENVVSSRKKIEEIAKDFFVHRN